MHRYLLTLAAALLLLPFQPAGPSAATVVDPKVAFDCSAMQGAVAGRAVSYTTRVKVQGRSRTIKLELLPCWSRSSAAGLPVVQLGFARRISGLPAGVTVDGGEYFTALESTLKRAKSGTSAFVSVREGRSTRFRGSVRTAYPACSTSLALGVPLPVTARDFAGKPMIPGVAPAQVLGSPAGGIPYFKEATVKGSLPVKHSVSVSYKFCGKTFKSPSLEFIVP